jgi:hypothetical protein
MCIKIKILTKRKGERCSLSELKIISFVSNHDGFVSLLDEADDWFSPCIVCVGLRPYIVVLD